MGSIIRLARGLAVCVLCAAVQPVFSQDREMDIRQIRSDRAEIEDDATLDEPLLGRVIELYDQAIADLERADEDRSAVANFEQERQNIESMARSLRDLLSDPVVPATLDNTVEWTAESAQSALMRERSRLAAYRAALQQAEQRSEERSRTRENLANQLGELDQELEEIRRDIRLLGEQEMPEALETAARTAALARRTATVSAIERLRQSLILLEERGVLLPLEVDLAERRVTASEDKVSLLENLSNELRRRSAEASLEHVVELADRVTNESPELADIAAETKALAEELWGPGGLIDRSDQSVTSVLETRKHLADVNRLVELTRRKFEAFGHRGSITRWWPQPPKDLPTIDSVNADIEALDLEIPEVQHRLILAEESRARLPALTRDLIRDLHISDPENPASDRVVSNARDVLDLRRDLLDQVVLEYSRYSNQLIEKRSLSTHFRDKMVAVERFLYSHLLWSRSVPRPIVPRPADVAEAASWFVSPEKRRELAGAGAGEAIAIVRGDILALILLVLLVVFRPRIKRRVEEISVRVADPTTDSYRYTLEAVLWTAALALPVPLLLFIAGGALYRSGGGVSFDSTAKALRMVSLTALLLEGTRQLFRAHGLAESHFGWPPKITRSLHRGLLWPEIIALPLLFIAIDLAFAGMRLASPKQLQVYNNSLGRIAFVVALLVLGVSILAMLRPEKKRDAKARDLTWSQRWAQYAFPTAFLIAYPVILIATIVPAVLAIFGYYITGLLLAYQMERTISLFLIVLIGGGVLHRWWRCRERTSNVVFDDELSDPKVAADVEAVNNHIRQLIRFTIIVVAALGLFSIWSDAFPLLQIMKRIQLLPRVELIEASDTEWPSLSALERVDDAGRPSDTANATQQSGEVPSTTPRPESETGANAPSATEAPRPLTLWSVLEAVLAALVTLVLVRNLPGLFELFLGRRTNLDSGARVAFSTLLRYSITMIGLVVVFGVLGVTWSKVQWLAAALTFGLGFGLQEIVANFVSGLILLVERPVRVGDMVTVGNLMGRVTRIQIRATTITLLDRSEMIVPNKEFITTKLVNWTLSDSKRRIEIPFRIAYGSDLEKVKGIVTEIARSHPDVLDDPVPHALLIEFAPDAIQLELRFVVDFGKGLAIRDQVQLEIDKAFREAGIEFALPRQKVEIVSPTDDDQGPLEVPAGAGGDPIPST